MLKRKNKIIPQKHEKNVSVQITWHEENNSKSPNKEEPK